MIQSKKYFLTQLKSHKKKSQLEFFQLIKNIKKQLQSKIQTSHHQSNYIEHLISIQKPKQLKTSSHHKKLLNNLYTPTNKQQDNRGQLQQGKTSQNQLNPKFQGVTIPSLTKKQRTTKKFNFIRKIQNKKHPLPYSSLSQYRINDSYPQMMQLRLSQSDRIMQGIQQPKFEYYFTKIPKRRQKRRNFHLYPALKYLKQINKFFKNIDQNLCLCLLNIGQIQQLKPGQLLYCVGFDRKIIYIILQGAISLTNSYTSMKKIYLTGQTLGQQMLFMNTLQKKLLETAKAITKSYILEIKINQYYQLCHQTKIYGYSPQIVLLQQKFKKGFTSKNLQRHQFIILDRKKKWMPHNYSHLYK